MPGTTSNQRFPAAIVSALLFAPLAVLRIVSWADTDHAWLFGRQLHWGCWFKQAYGIPCPTCGMTRSVILTLHGRISEAFWLNPGGVVLVGGILFFAILMMYRALLGRQTKQDPRRFAIYMTAYGWLLAIVVVGQWSFRLIH